MFGRAQIAVALGLVGVIPCPALAGWVTIKNETTQTIVVQETVVVNGAVRRCKPIKLVPGEVLREYQPVAGQKTIQVYEPGLLANKSLCQGELTWNDADQDYAVTKVGDKVKVMTAAEAVAAARAAAGHTARAQAPDPSKPAERKHRP